MKCAACGAINDHGRVYCGSCARSLGTFCAVCQFLNGEGIRYCGGCARDLLVAVAETMPAPAVVPVPAATPAFVPAPAAVRTISPRASADAFDNLEDLRCGPAPAPAVDGAAPQPAAADTTQDEIDGFFQRLVREGDAEIRPASVPTQPPDPPRRAPS